jgi:hypothetical protein
MHQFFTVELYANHQALLCIQKSTLHDFIIYSDSLSSLESIEQLYPTRQLLLNQIQDVIHNLAAGSRQKHRIRLGTKTKT